MDTTRYELVIDPKTRRFRGMMKKGTLYIEWKDYDKRPHRNKFITVLLGEKPNLLDL